MNLSSTRTLHNGVKMPIMGLGVWKVDNGEEASNAVKWALQAGYRMIDTAAAYKNEEGVGHGIKASGVAREEIFVTTKVWNSDQGYEKTLKAYDDSLQRLNLDYVDLYLIHWPVAGQFVDTWRAMEQLYKEGRVRAIGVCNFHQHHLEELMKTAEIKPMVNQIELHPQLTQEPLRSYCREQEIEVEAWSPLGQGKLLQDPVLVGIGERYQKTAAQVILRWDIQKQIITIPKSVNHDRILQNADIFDFELSSEELAKIDALNKNARFGADPDAFDF